MLLSNTIFPDDQLMATSATWFYLNPKIPEAEQARAQ